MEKYIPVITKKYSCKVSVDDIVYIRQHEKKLDIVTEEERYSYYEKMDNVVDYLDDRFYRIMKRLVVNLDKVTMVREQQIYFENGDGLYLGKDNYIKAKQRYTAHLRGLDK